jgi:hypothetical protein
MNRIIFDIETAPLPDAEDRILKLYPFDPDKVALGNRKDPAKIKEYIEQKRADHAGDLLAKAQLDPALSYVCAIGVLPMLEDELGEATVQVAKTIEDEEALLVWAYNEFKEVRDYRIWVGFNNTGFDLEFLFKRCWINGIPTANNLRKGRYWDANHVVDLMQEWGFHNNRNPWASLDLVAKTLGVADENRPDIKGKDFYKRLEDDFQGAMRYLMADLRETKAIAERILPPLLG